MKQYFGFELFLSSSDRGVLLPIITNLQKQYCNQPPFEPHISVYHSTKITNLTDAITAITKSADNLKSFTVESDGFGFKDIWSKILYIKIMPNQILSTIRAKIGTELGDTEIKPFTPHISLMYKDELSSFERTKIISNLKIPNTFTVQGIRIVSPGTLDNDWRDYTKWEVLYSITFPG